MPTFSTTSKTKAHKFSSVSVLEPNLTELRATAHQLMNQLTVIDFCVSELRDTLRPVSATSLKTLERTVAMAMSAAKLLSQQITQPDCHPEDPH